MVRVISISLVVATVSLSAQAAHAQSPQEGEDAGNAREPAPENGGEPNAESGEPDSENSGPAWEERLAAQEALIREQAQRIDALEARLNAESGTGGATEPEPEGSAEEDGDAGAPHLRSGRIDPLGDLTDPDFPGSTPLFGSDVRVGFGGYVKGDLLFDIGGHANPYQFTLAGIPVPSSSSEGYVTIHARESRFNLDFRYVSPDLPFNQAFIEVDFFNSDTVPVFNPPRLRHAYLRFGGLLVGRTWSSLTDFAPLPFIIDFAYGDAIYGGRTAQVRYETQVAGLLGIRVALEMLEFSGINNPSLLPGSARPRLPLFTLRFELKGDRGSVALGGSVGELRWDNDGLQDQYAPLASGVLSGRLNLLPDGRAFVGAQVSLGMGAGEDVVAFGGQNVNALLRPDGTLHSLPAMNFVISYGHQLVDLVSLNASLAWAEIFEGEALPPDTLQMGWALHANTILDATDFLKFGIEYMVGERRNFSDLSGTNHRIQTMAMYSF